MDDYPGIEIRVTRYHPDGPEVIFEGDSHLLHFQLMSMWLENGFTGHEWYPVRGGYMLGELLLEIRAVDLPELAAAPDCPAGLFRGQPGALAELAELERAAAGRIAERAAAAGREPPGDVDPAPGHHGCCCHAGFSGDHVCCVHPAPELAHVGQAAAWPGHDPAPVPPVCSAGDTGAAGPGADPGVLAELCQPTVSTRRRLRPGSAIARIARRALSRSGR